MAWPPFISTTQEMIPEWGEVDLADVTMSVGDEFALSQCDNFQVGRKLRELVRANTREQLIF